MSAQLDLSQAQERRRLELASRLSRVRGHLREGEFIKSYTRRIRVGDLVKFLDTPRGKGGKTGTVISTNRGPDGDMVDVRVTAGPVVRVPKSSVQVTAKGEERQAAWPRVALKDADVGRGPAGRVRNVKRMETEKLRREYVGLLREGGDPEAEAVFEAELANRGFSEQTIRHLRSTAGGAAVPSALPAAPEYKSSAMKAAVKGSKEWVDEVVERRRAGGGYSDEELEAYRDELYVRYGHRGPDAPRAPGETFAGVVTKPLKKLRAGDRFKIVGGPMSERGKEYIRNRGSSRGQIMATGVSPGSDKFNWFPVDTEVEVVDTSGGMTEARIKRDGELTARQEAAAASQFQKGDTVTVTDKAGYTRPGEVTGRARDGSIYVRTARGGGKYAPEDVTPGDQTQVTVKGEPTFKEPAAGELGGRHRPGPGASEGMSELMKKVPAITTPNLAPLPAKAGDKDVPIWRIPVGSLVATPGEQGAGVRKQDRGGVSYAVPRKVGTPVKVGEGEYVARYHDGVQWDYVSPETTFDVVGVPDVPKIHGSWKKDDRIGPHADPKHRLADQTPLDPSAWLDPGQWNQMGSAKPARTFGDLSDEELERIARDPEHPGSETALAALRTRDPQRAAVLRQQRDALADSDIPPDLRVSTLQNLIAREKQRHADLKRSGIRPDAGDRKSLRDLQQELKDAQRLVQSNLPEEEAEKLRGLRGEMVEEGRRPTEAAPSAPGAGEAVSRGSKVNVKGTGAGEITGFTRDGQNAYVRFGPKQAGKFPIADITTEGGGPITVAPSARRGGSFAPRAPAEPVPVKPRRTLTRDRPGAGGKLAPVTDAEISTAQAKLERAKKVLEQRPALGRGASDAQRDRAARDRAAVQAQVAELEADLAELRDRQRRQQTRVPLRTTKRTEGEPTLRVLENLLPAKRQLRDQAARAGDMATARAYQDEIDDIEAQMEAAKPERERLKAQQARRQARRRK